MSSPFFSTPQGNEDNQSFKGEPSKTYRMSYYGGVTAHIEIEVYYNQGVEVYYTPTGESHRWNWANRNKGWQWAMDRKRHIEHIQSDPK